MKVYLRSILLVSLFSIASFSAKACFEIPPNAPDWTIEQDPFDQYYAKLTLLNYTSYGADTSNYCACAINMPFQFGFPNSATIINVATGLPLEGFDFDYNFTCTDSLNNLFQPANFYTEYWNGFWSDVTIAIGSGVELNLEFELFVGLPQRTPGFGIFDEFVNFLDTASRVVVTTGADENGNPETQGAPIDHYSVNPLGTQIALPVELESFSVRPKGNGNQINWRTLTEIDHHRFELQKSDDGRSFSTVKEIYNPEGFSIVPKEYEYFDESPFEVTYYRLIAVATNGDFDFSRVISISREIEGEMEVSAFPNPTKSYVHIQNATGMDKVDVMDMNGRMIKSMKVQTTNRMGVDLSRYPAGIYLLNVRSGYKTTTIKLFKE